MFERLAKLFRKSGNGPTVQLPDRISIRRIGRGRYSSWSADDAIENVCFGGIIVFPFLGDGEYGSIQSLRELGGHILEGKRRRGLYGTIAVSVGYFYDGDAWISPLGEKFCAGSPSIELLFGMTHDRLVEAAKSICRLLSYGGAIVKDSSDGTVEYVEP